MVNHKMDYKIKKFPYTLIEGGIWVIETSEYYRDRIEIVTDAKTKTI